MREPPLHWTKHEGREPEQSFAACRTVASHVRSTTHKPDVTCRDCQLLMVPERSQARTEMA